MACVTMDKIQVKLKNIKIGESINIEYELIEEEDEDAEDDEEEEDDDEEEEEEEEEDDDDDEEEEEDALATSIGIPDVDLFATF